MSRIDPLIENRRTSQAAAWAVRLAEGKISAAQQQEFDAWLQEEPANGAALEEIVGAWEAVDHYAAAEPMMAMREAALASARRSSLRRSRAFAWKPWLRAACLVLGLLLPAMWLMSRPTSYSTNVGERRIVVLADGSTVSLDAESEVRTRYTDKERRLWLTRGRAQFSVAKNPLRPFSVQAGDDVVVATGTAFSVERLKKQVRVVLYEGHVALLQRDPQGPRPILTTQGTHAENLLVPGREIILTADTGHAPAGGRPAPASRSPIAAVEGVDPIPSLAWEEGQLAFQDEPLSVVAERMNRYTDTPLQVTDAKTAAIRISGVFKAGDTQALIEGLAAGFAIDARNSGRSIILYKRTS
jgi:transmembrane sensor